MKKGMVITMANKKSGFNKTMGKSQAHAKTDTAKGTEVSQYIDLLYMTPSELKARDIAEFITSTTDIRVELWDEMNIVELELSNQNTIDFEPLDINFQDPSDAAFIKNRKIKTIFAVGIKEADINQMKPIFDRIIEQFSGFLCSDTEDFNPVYAGTTSIKGE